MVTNVNNLQPIAVTVSSVDITVANTYVQLPSIPCQQILITPNGEATLFFGQSAAPGNNNLIISEGSPAQIPVVLPCVANANEWFVTSATTGFVGFAAVQFRTIV